MTMHGPAILARTLTPVRAFGAGGYRAQYHQQSDRHSKVVSWALMFDLLLESPLMQQHVRDGKVVAGVNHKMKDFLTTREKALDLVVARPGAVDGAVGMTFDEMAVRYDIRLSDEESLLLSGLPKLREGSVGSVLVALEAKAAMTAHQKARPRLYDELNSSHATVHGAADQAIAAAAVMVNASDDFLTFALNPLGVDSPPPLRYQRHVQPRDASGVVNKLEELPRRSSPGTFGFDAVGIVVVKVRNDGSPVSIVTAPPAPGLTSDFNYDQMVRRIVALYNFRFTAI